MTSLSPIASSLSMARQMSVARSAPAPAAPAVATDKGAGSTGSLIRTASEQLDQFDRVMEKLRSNMAAGAVTYGGAPAMGQGRIVDRLA